MVNNNYETQFTTAASTPVSPPPFMAGMAEVEVDKETGEVLDDAQGYGYKTKRNAYACYGYKNRDKSKDHFLIVAIPQEEMNI